MKFKCYKVSLKLQVVSYFLSSKLWINFNKHFKVENTCQMRINEMNKYINTNVNGIVSIIKNDQNDY